MVGWVHRVECHISLLLRGQDQIWTGNTENRIRNRSLEYGQKKVVGVITILKDTGPVQDI